MIEVLTEFWIKNICGCQKERAVPLSVFYIKEELTWYSTQQAMESSLQWSAQNTGDSIKFWNFSKIAREMLARNIRR